MHEDNDRPLSGDGDALGREPESTSQPCESTALTVAARRKSTHDGDGAEVEQLRLDKKRLQQELRRERQLHLRNVKCMSDMFETTVQVSGRAVTRV